MTYYKNWSCPNTASDWQIGRHDSCCALWDAKGASPFLGTLTGFWQASPDTHILALTHTYCLPLVQGTLTMLKCATLGPWHAHVCNVHPRCVFSLCTDNNKWCSCSRPSNLPRTTRNMSLAVPYVSQYGKNIQSAVRLDKRRTLNVSQLLYEVQSFWSLCRAKWLLTVWGIARPLKQILVPTPVIKQTNRVTLLSNRTFLRQ